MPPAAFRRLGPEGRRLLARHRKAAVKAYQVSQPATPWMIDTDESADWHRQILLDALGYPEGCIVRHCTNKRRTRGLCERHVTALYRQATA
jgi:hypothetical protein